MHSHNITWLVQSHQRQRLYEAEQDRLAQQIKSQPGAKHLRFASALGNWLIALGLRLSDTSTACPRWNLRANPQTPTRIIKV